MEMVEIIMVNIIQYVIFSFIFIFMGCMVGINKKIGYTIMIIIVFLTIFFIVSGMRSSISDGEGVLEGAVWYTLIGAFIGGWTGVYWYDISKNYTINIKKNIIKWIRYNVFMPKRKMW